MDFKIIQQQKDTFVRDECVVLPPYFDRGSSGLDPHSDNGINRQQFHAAAHKVGIVFTRFEKSFSPWISSLFTAIMEALGLVLRYYLHIFNYNTG